MNFNNPYSRKDYRVFFQNQFLTDDFKISEEKLSFEFMPQYLKSAFVIGEDKSLEIKVLEVLHDSENDPRVGLSKDIFRLMSSYGYKRALVLLHSSKSKNYRLSLATIELSLEGSKVKKEYSNPRRYSFFLGPDAKVKTPYNFLISKGRVRDFEDLLSRFSVEVVTKQFYQEIANWYFWALKNVKFPDDAEAEDNGRNIATIRLITRLIFIWFMKVRKLVPDELFDEDNLKSILKKFDLKNDNYYKAILQNLFFATLNTKQVDRRFTSKKKGYRGYSTDFGNPNVYRYEDEFLNSEEVIEKYFLPIPFLNGGLFECLDYKKSNIKDERKYIDGFTSTKSKQPVVPNYLFFADDDSTDLNKDYGTTNKKYTVRGLIKTLSLYNFTIDENDPNDADVALDPELLGKVFENLLASYNPETAKTARKSTGSYYTPRPIVDYMVDESLKQYFKTHIGLEEDERINKLFSDEEGNPFDEAETEKLVSLIDSLRAVDPAVGSGAFPMRLLNRLVFLLHKLDPDNQLWKKSQIDGIKKSVKDPILQRKFIEQVEKKFREKNPDYGRKLYLIEKCIYGVDIQQIAVEIAKLRFFISLLVDEKTSLITPLLAKERGWGEVENYGIEPLPNLDFKLMQGNSLISSFAGIDFNTKTDEKDNLFTFDDRYTKLIAEFEELKSQYQNEPDVEAKRKLKDDIDKKLLEIFEEKLNQHFPQLKEINEKAATIKNEAQRKEYIEKENKNLFKKIGIDLDQAEKDLIAYTEGRKQKNFFLWDVYFAEVFTDKGGFDIVIGNPPYIKEYILRSAFDGLRNSPYYKGKMDIWYMFACQGLDLLKEKTGILTFIAQNNWVTSYGASIMRNKVIKDSQMLKLLDFGNYMIFEGSDIQTMIMIFKKDSKIDNYQFDYRRLEGSDLNFEDVLDLIFFNTNPNAVYLKPIIRRNKFLNKQLSFSANEIEDVLEKIFEKNNLRLFENEVAQGIVCPQDFVNKESKKILGVNFEIGDGIFVLSNEEKEKIPFTQKELELIKPSYTTKELGRYYANKKNQEWVIYTDSKFKYPENIKPYPNIKRHLDKFQKVITSDNKPYGLHRARDEYFFKGEKIIAVRKCVQPTFTYTDFDCYVSATFYIIKTERVNQKYLTSLLNSKLIAFCLKNRGKMQGNNYQIDKEPLLALPLKEIPRDKQISFITIVDKILAAKQQNPQFDTKHLEDQIDIMVYKLYELTYEEVKIIDPQIGKIISKADYDKFRLQ